MIFMAFFHALGGSVGLLKRSKVQLPPTGGSVVEMWTTQKGQGPTPPSERVGWTFQTVQGPWGGGPVRRGGVLQSDARISLRAMADARVH